MMLAVACLLAGLKLVRGPSRLSAVVGLKSAAKQAVAAGSSEGGKKALSHWSLPAEAELAQVRALRV